MAGTQCAPDVAALRAVGALGGEEGRCAVVAVAAGGLALGSEEEIVPVVWSDRHSVLVVRWRVAVSYTHLTLPTIYSV